MQQASDLVEKAAKLEDSLAKTRPAKSDAGPRGKEAHSGN
jgi:hypothetical protein